MVSVPSGMKNLQRYAPTLGVHRLSQRAMPLCSTPRRQARSEGRQPAFYIRCESTGDDQTYAPARTGSEISRKPREKLCTILEPRMHGTHEHAIRQSRETEIQRSEKVGIKVSHDGVLLNDALCWSEKP